MNLFECKKEVETLNELIERAKDLNLKKVSIYPYIVEMEERYWLPCLRIETENHFYDRMITKKFPKENVKDVEDCAEELAKSVRNYLLAKNFIVTQKQLKYENKAPKRMKDEEADFFLISILKNSEKKSNYTNFNI